MADAPPLLLSSMRRTCQRNWNHPHITADEKRLASDYLKTHGEDARKVFDLNKRLLQLITDRTPAHQR